MTGAILALLGGKTPLATFDVEYLVVAGGAGGQGGRLSSAAYRGGGGGGASLNGNTSGAGGLGGRGEIWVYEYY